MAQYTINPMATRQTTKQQQGNKTKKMMTTATLLKQHKTITMLQKEIVQSLDEPFGDFSLHFSWWILYILSDVWTSKYERIDSQQQIMGHCSIFMGFPLKRQCHNVNSVTRFRFFYAKKFRILQLWEPISSGKHQRGFWFFFSCVKNGRADAGTIFRS